MGPVTRSWCELSATHITAHKENEAGRRVGAGASALPREGAEKLAG